MFYRLQHFSNETDLGIHPCADHNAFTTTIADQGTHESSILTVPKWDIGFQAYSCVLLHRD